MFNIHVCRANKCLNFLYEAEQGFQDIPTLDRVHPRGVRVEGVLQPPPVLQRHQPADRPTQAAGQPLQVHTSRNHFE